MRQEIVSLSKILLSVPSVARHLEYINMLIDIIHEDLADYNHTRYMSNRVPSLLYYNTETVTTPFRVILNSNIDVVPGKEFQFKPYVKNDTLFARGAYDMKGATAVMVLVFKELAHKVNYPLALQITSDQEIGGNDGTKYQIDQGIRGDFVITSSTTNMAISNESKGEIWLRITTKGRGAPGSYLWQGENAILKMRKFLDELEKKFPVATKDTWETTINVASIKTPEEAFSSVPQICEVVLNIKFIPEEEKSVVKQIKALLPENSKADVLILQKPHFTPKDNEYITLLSQAFEKARQAPPQIVPKYFTSEIRHYNAVNGHGVSFGPTGGGAHSDEEWVDVKSLVDYYMVLKEFLLSIK